MEDLNKYIDHTQLAAHTTASMINTLCSEARNYNFKAVCVNPYHVAKAAELLNGSDVLVATVAGFPLGATYSKTKALEASIAVEAGAAEIDMVLNIGALLDGDLKLLEMEIAAVRKACSGSLLKVILETCLLTEQQIIDSCRISVDCGADFVKTSTGFASGGATIEAVRLMRQTVGPEIGVKASGGIRTREQALAMIEAGANRIGTSSGAAICGN